MAEESAVPVAAPPERQPPANVIDVKVHGVTKLPVNWVADAGPAPTHPDHVFRYEADIQIADTVQTLGCGRLLQALPMYTEYAEAARLPPLQTGQEADGDESDVGEVPDLAMAPAPALPAAPSLSQNDGGSAPMTGRSQGGASQGLSAGASTATAEGSGIFWVVGPEADVDEPVPVPTKKDAKAAPAKKGQAAPPPPPEAVKPLQPTTSATPPCIARFPLSMSQLTEFEEQVERHVPLSITIRRVLRPHCPPDWEDQHEARFRGIVNVPLKALTEPGATRLEATVALEPPVVEQPKEDDKTKKKAAPKKTKGGVPAALQEEVDPNEPHPYVAHGTTCHISIQTQVAVTRLPEGRPRPSLQPSDMIPARVRAAARPLDATARFTKEVAGIAARVVRDFREQTRGDAETEATFEDQRAAFMQQLQSSGRGRVYQELLLPSIQAVVRETFIRKPSPSAEEMSRVANELYTYLLDHLHLALNRAFGPIGGRPSAADSPQETDAVARWLQLATEAEVLQEFAAAAKFHQERIVQCRANDADLLPTVWREYAEFCLRVRDALKAEQGYREALALDMESLPVLQGYGVLLLARQRFKEAEVFLQAAVDVAPGVRTWGCLAVYYDSLLEAVADSPEEQDKRAVYVREGKYATAQAARAMQQGGQGDVPGSLVYEEMAGYLLELHHEDLAALCLGRCDEGRSVDLLWARMYLQTKQHDEATGVLLRRLDADPGTKDAAAHLLLGDIFAAMGPERSTEAEHHYDTALRIDPDRGTGPAYVRLGNMYVGLGKYKDALSAFLVGCRVWPCGLTWLGTGIAYFRLDDLARAEQALNESNVRNNLNPKTWAYLALVCLRQRREDEGDQAFNQAVKQGLADPYLIAEVGAEQARLSRHRIAEACFRRALALHEDPNARMLLGRSLVAMRRLPEAREEFEAVAASSPSQAQQQRAQEQLASLPDDE